jgi:hypothetical protein
VTHFRFCPWNLNPFSLFVFFPLVGALFNGVCQGFIISFRFLVIFLQFHETLGVILNWVLKIFVPTWVFINLHKKICSWVKMDYNNI